MGDLDLEFLASLEASIDQIGVLGCDATHEEFATWYESVQTDLEVVVEGENGTEAVDEEAYALALDQAYVTYSSVCFGVNYEFEVPDLDIVVPTKEKESKLGMYIVGATLVYLLLKKK